ncbi:hypothetical protein CYJ76_03855 [Kytococcus schroeteri]|uniref:Toxin-antitoxin system HicB family antitoxin n=1 Tax=Kytococcus schroeteri TaxID=138300 RepID=A0A2I1PC28_9MICO|nr:hypothetical protein HMPREF3099_07915 [Kytococcus sp. HMSC28H12]PKZ42189.1 hypothetical protein CYJ76_03855 [Kytococcus schroeteri]
MTGMPAIRLHGVPEQLRQTLIARATTRGLSLNDYLVGESGRVSEHPARQELLRRIRARGTQRLPPAADLLVTERPHL